MTEGGDLLADPVNRCRGVGNALVPDTLHVGDAAPDRVPYRVVDLLELVGDDAEDAAATEDSGQPDRVQGGDERDEERAEAVAVCVAESDQECEREENAQVYESDRGRHRRLVDGDDALPGLRSGALSRWRAEVDSVHRRRALLHHITRFRRVEPLACE